MRQGVNRKRRNCRNVGGDFGSDNFFAYPLRSLNEILDRSKATSARPRKLGLRPQTVRVRPAGRFLRPRPVPQNFVGPLLGHTGLGEMLLTALTSTPCGHSRHATESEG